VKFSVDGNVYESDGKITKLIGGLVIERIEGDEKVTYTFNEELGEYEETAREPYTPPEPEPDPLSLLEEENALLALELVQTQLRLDQVEQEQADLLLLLVSEGVV
jgi:hypothetical protein